jgi:hypothetical protein|tara:strand:- start:84 stop:437 length:354 start_codon:yes stop_codon:yes gene_type:complete
MGRNRLAGTTKGNSKSALLYQKNPEAKAKKDAYNKKYNATPKATKKRSFLGLVKRKRIKAGTSKVGDGYDLSEKKGKDGKVRVVKERPNVNRGATGNMPGDVRARGGKKKSKLYNKK